MALGGSDGGLTGGLFNDDAAAETVDENTEYPILTRKDGTRIDWKSVVMVASGIFSTAFFQGLANFIRGLFETYLIHPLQAIGGLLNLILTALWGTAPAVIRGAFQGAAQWVAGLGPAAFVVGVAIVVLTAYVFARGINRE